MNQPTESEKIFAYPHACIVYIIAHLVDISHRRLLLHLLQLGFGNVHFPVPDRLFLGFVRLSFCFCLRLSLRKLLVR